MWLIFMIICANLTFSISVKAAEERRECDGVEIVWREDWKAKSPIRRKYLALPVNKVIIAHTATAPCWTKLQCIRNIQMIQDNSIDYDGMFDVPYNFLIGGDGRVYEGTGWQYVGSHTLKFNYISIGIGFVGNYNLLKPTQKVLDAALNLIRCGVKLGCLTPTREIHGHRDVVCMESPGDNLYAIIRNWKNFKGGRMPHYNCEP